MYWGGINSGVSCQRKHFNLVKLYGRLAVTIRVRESGGGMRENEATFQFVEAAFLLQGDPNVLLILVSFLSIAQCSLFAEKSLHPAMENSGGAET